MLNGYPSHLHKDARVTDVPSGWHLRRLKDACVLRNKLRKPISKEVRRHMEGSYPYYGPTSMVDSINEYQLDGRYALLGEDGDHFLKYNKMSMSQLIEGKCNVNNHAHILEGKHDCMTEWIFLFFRHRNIYHFLSRQGAGRYKLNKASLMNLPILVPPIDEQERIWKIVSSWENAVELTGKLELARHNQKRALVQRLFDPIDSDWKTHKLGNLFSERKEQDRTDLPLLSITREKGVVRRDSLARKDKSTKDKSKYKRIAVGDIGYNTMRMWQGVSALSPLEGIVSPAYTVCIPNKEIDGRFAAHLFKLPRIVHRFYRYSQGLVSDTWNLKYRHFSQVEVALPKRDIQVRIASALDNVDKMASLEERKREALENQKRGLISQMVSGRTRVDQAESELSNA